MNDYSELTARNLGYISKSTQEKISKVHIFIAGCGIGSQVAVALSRMGIQNFSLIDGDTVSQSNLNRQCYDYGQIGQNKSQALADQIHRINPKAHVKVYDHHFGIDQMSHLEKVDVVIDTIDFLDLKSILLLHEAAEHYKKPLISGMSVGWGSCSIFFSNAGSEMQQFRKIFDINDSDFESLSYAVKFAQLFEKIKSQIDPMVVRVMNETFAKLANNQPCPAPQVVGGSYNLASLICSLLFQYVNGDKVPESPYLVISDTNKLIAQSLFNLGNGS